jgi:hypothetical protein
MLTHAAHGPDDLVPWDKWILADPPVVIDQMKIAAAHAAV